MFRFHRPADPMRRLRDPANFELELSMDQTLSSVHLRPEQTVQSGYVEHVHPPFIAARPLARHRWLYSSQLQYMVLPKRNNSPGLFSSSSVPSIQGFLLTNPTDLIPTVDAGFGFEPTYTVAFRSLRTPTDLRAFSWSELRLSYAPTCLGIWVRGGFGNAAGARNIVRRTESHDCSESSLLSVRSVPHISAV